MTEENQVRFIIRKENNKIFKYPLFLKESNIVRMPLHSAVLSFQFQNDIPCIWVAVNDDNVFRDRQFSIIGTGWEYSKNNIYLGTAQNNGFVWHLFEVI